MQPPVTSSRCFCSHIRRFTSTDKTMGPWTVPLSSADQQSHCHPIKRVTWVPPHQTEARMIKRLYLEAPGNEQAFTSFCFKFLAVRFQFTSTHSLLLPMNVLKWNTDHSRSITEHKNTLSLIIYVFANIHNCKNIFKMYRKFYNIWHF
jgi:hypothetical protein